MDGSYFIKDRIKYARAAVVTSIQTIWAYLRARYLNPESRIDCCYPGFQMGKGDSTTTYTDSYGALATIHVHGII